MNLSRATYAIIVLLVGLQSAAVAQVETTRIDSAIIDSTVLKPVVLPLEKPEEKETEEPAKLFKVTPWEFHAPIGADLVATDSTLRWQIWPDWTYRLNREPGVISYRLGTNIRTNAVLRYAHEPRHQQLYWEGISLNDPVSGTLDWALIPQHKISEFYSEELGTQHRSTYYHHQYYLNKPLSRIIYSESKFSYRNLEFEISHNLSQRTNVELSYWDRRSGGEFPNSEITGQQIYGKISHHLDRRRYLKLNYINNNYDIGQPFGYNITNPFNYSFDRFATSANQSSARSQKTTSLLALNYYQRSPDTTQATDNLHAGLFYQGNERTVNALTDSTRYKIQSVGINANKWWQWGGLSVQGRASYEYFFNQSTAAQTLPANNWTLLKTEGKMALDFTPLIDLKGDAAFRLRSDGFQSYRLNVSSDIEIGNFRLTPGASSGSVIPTLQQLHWNSSAYSGNRNLENEKIQEVRAELAYNFTADTKVGLRAQHKDIIDGIMMTDSTFSNVGSYASQSATAFFEWDMTHFELEGSATAHRFTDSYTKPSNTIPMSSRKRVWLKGSAYWKGYLFDRATYVKAGVSGMHSPFNYRADHYNPELDTWQPVSDDQLLPVFNRMDVDISARVRSIVFTIRWENVLDDVSQLGYFETAQYPMSNRRFIFGVRALFRN